MLGNGCLEVEKLGKEFLEVMECMVAEMLGKKSLEVMECVEVG